MKQSHKTLLLWILMILTFVAIYQFLQPEQGVESIAYSDFLSYATDGQIESVTIRGDAIQGTYRENRRRFSTRGPASSEALQALAEGDVRVNFEEQVSPWAQSLASIVPALVLVVVLVVAMRRMTKPGRDVTEIQEPRVERVGAARGFAELGGLEAAKVRLQPLVQWKLAGAPAEGRPPCGYLVTGAPGTGKTALVRALAGEMGLQAFEVGGAGFLDMFVGVGAARVKKLFEAARKEAPSLVILDHLDVVCPTRGADGEKGADERQSTFAALCAELDRTGSDRVTVVGVTNRPDRVDPALTRSGRLGVHIDLALPNEAERREVLAKVLAGAPDLDLDALAVRCEGLTPADLADLRVRTSAPLTQAKLESALDAIRAEHAQPA